MGKQIEYSNGELTIVWQPELCRHAGICVKTLPNVYHPKERPWIKMENATTEELIAQIKMCPSGALSDKLIFQRFFLFPLRPQTAVIRFRVFRFVPTAQTIWHPIDRL